MNKAIKQIYLFSLIMLFPLITLAATPAQQLQTILTHTQSMQGNFQQTLYDNKGTVLQKSKGKMAVQRPEKFRWEMKSPNQQLLIADGQQLWNYDVGLEQVTVEPFTKRAGTTPALLLSGSTKGLLEEYTVTLNDSHWYLLKPRATDSEFQSIKLRFKGQILQTMELLDSLGQTSKLQFSNVKLNPKLKASLFQFKPPKGVDVIRKKQ